MDPTTSNAAQLAAIRRAHDERWRRAHPEEAAARDSARDALAAARDDRPTASPPLPTLAPGQTEYPRAFDAENESDDPTADPSSDGDADPSSGEHAPPRRAASRRATTAASDDDEDDDRRGVLFGAGLAAGLVGWQALSAARTVARALGTLPAALQRERDVEALARVRADAVRRARDDASSPAPESLAAAEAASRAAQERADAALAERLQREEREAAILERSAARASAYTAGEDPDVFEASARLDAITRLDASVPSLANLDDDDDAAAADPPSDPEDLEELEGVRMSRQAAIGYLLSDPTEGGADDPSSDATHPLVAAVASRLRTFASAVSDGDETDLARRVDVFLDALGDIDAAVEEAMPSPSSFASGDGDGGGLSGASSGGLSASAIRGLPTRTYRARTDGGSADEPPHCAVCLCDAEEGEEIKTLPCAHRFHAKCVDRWLRGHRSCPMCKSDVGAMGARALAARDEAPEATRYRRAPTSRRSGAVASAR